jgi:hypothetical protein
MTASPRVLVLCNDAPRPEDQGEYKNVLTLAYHPNAPAKRNIELALPNFVRGVYHLPDRLLDLLEIAAYVFSADRLCATTTRAVSPAKPGWESEETPIGQPPYLASKDNGDHSMAEKRKAKRRR